MLDIVKVSSVWTEVGVGEICRLQSEQKWVDKLTGNARYRRYEEGEKNRNLRANLFHTIPYSVLGHFVREYLAAPMTLHNSID